MTRPTSPVEQARRAIEQFLASCKEPVLLEPGEDPVNIEAGNWALEYHGGNLMLQAWDAARNIARRVNGLISEKPGRLEFSTTRFGKRNGTVLLMDRKGARFHDGDMRAARLTYRELFRRGLRRQYPEWRIAELSTEPGLEHSLSPSYPRALLRKGATGWAAIGAPPQSPDAAGALTFGLVWLDYLRTRERRLTIEGLAIFLPAGRERVACLRLRHLNPRAAQFAVFVYGPDGAEDRVDLADYGNLDTSLTHSRQSSPEQPGSVETWVDRIAMCEGVERVLRNDGSTSLRVRGLEFARATATALSYGVETRRTATASNLAEIEHLAGELARMRSADAANRENPLYARSPEGWLESRVRAGIQEIDAALAPAPIYGQVPAFTAGDRDVIDLLAADHTGRLAVLELKATEDIHLPMQALDYWMRVKWHAARNEFTPAGYFPGLQLRADPPRLLLVAPALAFHPSNEIVLRYFSPDVQIERIGVGLEWRKKLKVMFRY